ncbi:sulfurtransferase [Marmoricola endophyticus]|uniref:Sulfurtransferase n=1 Tax=Marmoricola endophyticus TaxID=2040280 RepID=A0A917F3W0_9ACTN|nr:rhodanese-like domain-containing protein [Marmoricola endophyticus]GGF47752.1 sulfurtransferase [Marmoricola endophyticus]
MQIPTVAVAGVPDPLPEGLTVLDVREDAEWEAGHVDGAVHVPLAEVPQRLDDLAERAAGAQVLVVCKVGGRSAQATGYLQQNGVEAVNLDGGMLEWEAAGRPMVSESGAPAQVV